MSQEIIMSFNSAAETHPLSIGLMSLWNAIATAELPLDTVDNSDERSEEEKWEQPHGDGVRTIE